MDNKPTAELIAELRDVAPAISHYETRQIVKQSADRLAELEENNNHLYEIITGLREDIVNLGKIIQALCRDDELPEPTPGSKYWHNLAVAKRKSMAKQALQHMEAKDA